MLKAIRIGERFSNSHRHEGGFTLVESILVVVVAVAFVVAIWYFGWMADEPAGETALADHQAAIQKQVVLYMFDSSGQYPTIDGMLPEQGEYEPIYWDASFTKGSQTYSFFPDYVQSKPKHWDEGVWRIDSEAKVSVNINPKDY